MPRGRPWTPGSAALLALGVLLLYGAPARSALPETTKLEDAKTLGTTLEPADGEATTTTVLEDGETTTSNPALSSGSGVEDARVPADADVLMLALMEVGANASDPAGRDGGSVKKNMAPEAGSAGESARSGNPPFARSLVPAVVSTNGTKVDFPGEMAEDFMEDMQEVVESNSDMVMADRSANDVPVDADGDGSKDNATDATVSGAPMPVNHRPTYGPLATSKARTPDQNAIAKQSKYATAPPPRSAHKYEMMMANLPVKDYSLTGRDKPINVVFVFPQVKNETRKRELEVVLVFPQNKTEGGQRVEIGDRVEPTPVLGQGKERDIYKKHANKYKRGPLPSSIVRPDAQSVLRSKVQKTGGAPRTEDDPLEAGASEVRGVSAHAPAPTMRPIVVAEMTPRPQQVQFARQPLPPPARGALRPVARRRAPPTQSPLGSVAGQQAVLAGTGEIRAQNVAPNPSARLAAQDQTESSIVTDLKRTRSRQRPSLLPTITRIATTPLPTPTPVTSGKGSQRAFVRHPASRVGPHGPAGVAPPPTTPAPAAVDLSGMRQRLAALQRMLVGHLLSIQRELSSRQARPGGNPEPRNQADGDLAPRDATRTAIPAASKRYRRPPAYRRPAPAADAPGAELATTSTTSAPSGTHEGVVGRATATHPAGTTSPSHSREVPPEENEIDSVAPAQAKLTLPQRGPTIRQRPLIPHPRPDDDVAAKQEVAVVRDDRSTPASPSPPSQQQSGFLPLPVTRAEAPQIVGPIPQGYREVVQGLPVQLDLPLPAPPQDFQEDTAPDSPGPQAALA